MRHFATALLVVLIYQNACGQAVSGMFTPLFGDAGGFAISTSKPSWSQPEVADAYEGISGWDEPWRTTFVIKYKLKVGETGPEKVREKVEVKKVEEKTTGGATKEVVTTTTVYEKYRDPIKLSLNFGYTYLNRLRYKNDAGMTARFPLGGFILSAFYPIVPGKPFSLLAGAATSFYQLTTAPATYTQGANVSEFVINSPITFAPEISLGLTWEIVDELSFFLDGSYQFASFTVSYDKVPTGMPASARPETINASAAYIRLGISIDAKKL